MNSRGSLCNHTENVTAAILACGRQLINATLFMLAAPLEKIDLQ
jgi:hypothetical protein